MLEKHIFHKQGQESQENQYLSLLQYILEKGEDREDRTGIGVCSVFGSTMRFSLEKSFPLLTTKKLHFKSIVYELLWFLRGDTNTRYLNNHGVTIWDEWADQNGDLGPVYGAQWRKWTSTNGETIDQIALLVKGLQQNPFGRRHIISAWNVGELGRMALPPCHILAQFYVSKAGGLSCQLYQRSVDVFLGLPFNIASYALLTCILAKLCGFFAQDFCFVGGDTHLYKNHLKQAQTQLSRKPYPFPTLEVKYKLDSLDDLMKLDYTDIIMQNYNFHPSLPAPVAI